MSIQFEKFLDKENFILAYFRLQNAPNNLRNEVFYYEDLDSFGTFLNKNIEQLISDIRDSKYTPIQAERYYIPKKNHLARPVSLLYFIDLLVYQAICNVILDVTKDNYAAEYNNTIFSNLPTSEDDYSYAQFKYWKGQWKLFKSKVKNYFLQGYKYIAEFDIASFYDTINHGILKTILKNIGIEDDLLQLLMLCLKKWTISSVKNLEERYNGIPQGPECSAVLAEIYFREIDKVFIEKVRNVKYLRYVDDIRIMAKEEIGCQKGIAYLDIFCRDYMVLAQPSKVLVKELTKENIHTYLDATGIKFSRIASEYRFNGKLGEKSHNKLKRKLRATLDNTNNLYLDKSILKFVFFKLNKDDEVRDIILENWDKLYLTFEGVIYYLNKYYASDDRVLERVHNLLLSEDVLFQYNKAIIFDKFTNLPFYEDVYQNIIGNIGNRFWIVKYFSADWLSRQDYNRLALEFLSETRNYFISRKRLKVELDCASKNKERELLARKYYNKDPMLAIYALRRVPYLYKNLTEDDASDYVLNVLQLDTSDYIMNYLNKNYSIDKQESKGLVRKLKVDIQKYYEAISDLEQFQQSLDKYADRALQFLDLFHNIIIDLINDNEEMDFGVKIEQLKQNFPHTYYAFNIIHLARNQRTSAHYKDKRHKIRELIDGAQLRVLLTSCGLGDAYREMCEYFN